MTAAAGRLPGQPLRLQGHGTVSGADYGLRRHTLFRLYQEPHDVSLAFELAARCVHMRNSPWIAIADHAWLAQNPFAPLAEARDGVLYLDQVEKLDKAEQRGLAQVISKLDKFNVRLIATAIQPLVPMVEAGEFDSALYHQIAAVVLRVPSLSEHSEDIPDIANTLLLQLVEANECPLRQLTG